MLFTVNNILTIALAASPLVAAHGKIAVMTGDMGGNGTALGIQGGVVPGPGPNGKTELDTTVFGNTNIMSDGLGKTTGQGGNAVSKISRITAQSGTTLPQVSDGGQLSGTFHIVTTDGAGPVKSVIDATGTGKFSKGLSAKVLTQVPGNGGNIKPPRQRAFIPRTLVKLGLLKRASNVNEDFPVSIKIPAGITCTGTAPGVTGNVCLAKIANANAAGPFGGVVPFQIAGGNTTAKI